MLFGVRIYLINSFDRFFYQPFEKTLAAHSENVNIYAGAYMPLDSLKGVL